MRGEDLAQPCRWVWAEGLGRSGWFILNFGLRHLHFEPVGVFKQVGYKFGRYWDVA